MNSYQLGIYIAQLRKDKGLTQKQLADLLFISQSAVSKWEKGISSPDIYMLKRLSEVFQVEVSELLNEPIGKTIINKTEDTRKQKTIVFGKSHRLLITLISIISVAFVIFIGIHKLSTSPNFEIVDSFVDSSGSYYNGRNSYQILVTYRNEPSEEELQMYIQSVKQAYEKIEDIEALVILFFKDTLPADGLESYDNIVCIPLN